MAVTRYGLVENSGGPGKSRGGYALIRGFKILSDEASLHVRSDRRSILPYGVKDGAPGTHSWNIINAGRDQYVIPVCPMRPIPLRDSELWKFQTDHSIGFYFCAHVNACLHPSIRAPKGFAFIYPKSGSSPSASKAA